MESVVEFLTSEDKLTGEIRFSLAVAIGAVFMIILPTLLFGNGRDEYDEIIEKYSRPKSKKKQKGETPQGDHSVKMRKGYTKLEEE